MVSRSRLRITHVLSQRQDGIVWETSHPGQKTLYGRRDIESTFGSPVHVEETLSGPRVEVVEPPTTVTTDFEFCPSTRRGETTRAGVRRWCRTGET